MENRTQHIESHPVHSSWNWIHCNWLWLNNRLFMLIRLKGKISLSPLKKKKKNSIQISTNFAPFASLTFVCNLSMCFCNFSNSLLAAFISLFILWHNLAFSPWSLMLLLATLCSVADAQGCSTTTLMILSLWMLWGLGWSSGESSMGVVSIDSGVTFMRSSTALCFLWSCLRCCLMFSCSVLDSWLMGGLGFHNPPPSSFSSDNYKIWEQINWNILISPLVG